MLPNDPSISLILSERLRKLNSLIIIIIIILGLVFCFVLFFLADKLLLTQFCSSCSPVFTSALGSVFCKWDLPVFTLPFNLALTLYLAASGPHNLFFPTTIIQPATATPNITWTDAEMPMVGFYK